MRLLSVSASSALEALAAKMWSILIVLAPTSVSTYRATEAMAELSAPPKSMTIGTHWLRLGIAGSGQVCTETSPVVSEHRRSENEVPALIDTVLCTQKHTC